MADERIRLDLRQARRSLKEASAKAQEFATHLRAEWGDDWEERYMAEGLIETQAWANEETP